MLSLGIDVGHQTVKAVLVEDGLVAGKVILRVAGSVEGATMAATESLSTLLGLKKGEISQRVFVTGVGREKVSRCHGRPTEMASHVRGVHHWFSSARTVVDMGAEGIRVSRCDSQGRLLHFVLNDRCGAGTGVFLETVAEMMGVGLEEMGSLGQEAGEALALTSTCAIFAESEIVAHVHRGVKREKILWAVHDAVAARAAALVQRSRPEPLVVGSGGVARNRAIVASLERHLGVSVLIPPEPEMMGALGAALLAQE
ncbi:MAG: acyl-CoA dehydratase activase [Thermodesulfobacteriota bacterium]